MAKTYSDDELKQKLSPEQYSVLRKGGTEAPFSGDLLYNKEEGTYTCKVCGAPLFSSKSKFDSTTPGLIGWPSFSDLMDEGSVELKEDNSLFGMKRTEVICKNCGSHLGHLFDDKAAPDGKHYCINSVCLNFNPDKKDGNS